MNAATATLRVMVDPQVVLTLPEDQRWLETDAQGRRFRVETVRLFLRYGDMWVWLLAGTNIRTDGSLGQQTRTLDVDPHDGTHVPPAVLVAMLDGLESLREQLRTPVGAWTRDTAEATAPR